MDDDEEPGRTREGGAFSEEYPDEAFLAPVRERGPVRTGDVAAAVGCHRATALRRLRQLEGEGAVESLEAGASTTVWTLAEDGGG